MTTEDKHGCDCIDTISATLEEHRLDTAIMFDRAENRLVSRTYTDLKRKDNGRSESRRGKPSIFAHTFCLFCGTRYDPAPAAQEGGAA